MRVAYALMVSDLLRIRKCESVLSQIDANYCFTIILSQMWF